MLYSQGLISIFSHLPFKKKKNQSYCLPFIRYNQKIVHVVNFLIKCDCVTLTIHTHEQYKSTEELNWVDLDHINWVLFKILGIENSRAGSFKPLFSSEHFPIEISTSNNLI